MKNVILAFKRINKETIEHLLMSVISGFLVSLYLVFSKEVGATLFEGNFFFGFVLLTILIMNYYIKNLRKYFLSDNLSVALFLLVGIFSYMILK